MNSSDVAILSAIISIVGTILANIVSKRLSRRGDLAVARHEEADAAESITTAARGLIDPLNEEIKELRDKNTQLGSEIRDMRTDRERDRIAIVHLGEELVLVKLEQRRADDALEYLVSATKEQYPEAVEIAWKIRRGELKL